MNVVAPLMFFSLVLIALAARFAPEQWRWPVIGVIAFFAIFISTRILSRVITDAFEKRFNRRD